MFQLCLSVFAYYLIVSGLLAVVKIARSVIKVVVHLEHLTAYNRVEVNYLTLAHNLPLPTQHLRDLNYDCCYFLYLKPIYSIYFDVEFFI